MTSEQATFVRIFRVSGGQSLSAPNGPTRHTTDIEEGLETLRKFAQEYQIVRFIDEWVTTDQAKELVKA